MRTGLPTRSGQGPHAPLPTLLPRALARTLACALATGLLASAASAAPNPFDGPPVPGKTPYDGPQYPGKPPAAGRPAPSPADANPFAGGPIIPSQPAGPGRPGTGTGSNPGTGTRPRSSGTGFAVAPGRILTNNHVVEDCGRMEARNSQGQRTEARTLATDTTRDLAVLSVPETFAPALAFRDGPAVRRGETVVTYGFPLTGLLSSGPSLTTGDISALTGLRDNPRNFTISAPVQPGNSGGPLLDAQGNVIGVIVTKLNAARVAQMTGGDIPQNVNFAIKGAEALAFLRARGVSPRTAASTGPDLRNSDVGDLANPATVFLQCFR